MPESRIFEAVRPPQGTGPARARLSGDAGELGLAGDWRFRWAPTPDLPPEPSADGTDWGTIPVPGHWQLNGFGSPAYTNFQYPFPVDAPYVPEQNPTGDYRTIFSVPAQWEGGRVLLRFDGVDSWFELWINGERVGDSSGSRLTVEFDVTRHLVPGDNLLALRAHQWSFASYVEDQDQWWLSGIFRGVTLLHRPDGGIDDLFVHADFDRPSGRGSLVVDGPAGASVAIAELGMMGMTGERWEGQVQPWSAEEPRLYELVVSTAAETVTLQVGFRRVEVVGVELHVNGVPITFRGVNRHDFHPRTGRAVDHATMESDVLLMKAHNLNALRTSHYPPDPYLLELCDQHGLYVIEECDIETHGFSLVDWRGNPSDDPAWAEVYLDRMRRMVERDKNHASVLIWSLGNEAGWGANLEANARWAKSLDPSRPIHYEQDAECRVADVYSRMYATFEELDEIGRQDEPRLPDAARDARRRGIPMMQCEYAHAMGNGPGGLADYEELFDAHPRLIGGFVWEWFDHGLERVDAEGRPGYAFGGDFGERRHDGSFVIDGLLFPDRTPSPGLAELAAVIAPVRFTFGDGAVTVENRRSFVDTGDLVLSWVLEEDGLAVGSGILDLTVAPLSRATATLPELPPTVGETFLTVTATTRQDAAWARAGHVVARVQAAVHASVRPRTAGTTGQVTVKEEGFAIAGARFDARGRLVELGGTEVVLARADAWRAPTENDRCVSVEGELSMESLWREQGLDRLEERVASATVEGDELVVVSRIAGAATDVGLAVTTRWGSVDGALHLSMTITREGEWRVPLPRLGLTLALRHPDSAAVPVRWFGLGPGESYPDSRAAAHVGLFDADVRSLQTPYVVPQENGRRADVRWAQLRLANSTLQVRGSFDLTVRPWSPTALELATHAPELEPDGLLWLHLDVGANGLGSAACGPGVRNADRFVVSEKTLELTFTSN